MVQKKMCKRRQQQLRVECKISDGVCTETAAVVPLKAMSELFNIEVMSLYGLLKCCARSKGCRGCRLGLSNQSNLDQYPNHLHIFLVLPTDVTDHPGPLRLIIQFTSSSVTAGLTFPCISTPLSLGPPL